MLTSDKLAGSLVGKYRIEALFGEGGMAYVYKGIHTDLDLPIALKVLFPELARQEEVRDRFKREARLQFKLKHPNVVRVIDLIDEDGILGMVMDWVQGQDMSDFLRLYGRPLPSHEIKRLFLPILSAVGHAHQQNIIHRDLKPANILLEGDYGQEIPKVMDFGIAKSLDEDSSKTKTGLVMGTPYYLAPEQARGSKQIDHRADIYSLGVTLYQMLTAQLPYDGDSAIAIITAHCMEPIPTLQSVLPGIDPRLDQLIQQAMAKEPSQRFNTCEEFANELNKVLPDGSSINVNSSPNQWDEETSAAPLNRMLATGNIVQKNSAEETAISALDTMQFSGEEEQIKKLRTNPQIKHNTAIGTQAEHSSAHRTPVPVAAQTRAEAPKTQASQAPSSTQIEAHSHHTPPPQTNFPQETHYGILEEHAETKKQPIVLILTAVIAFLLLGIVGVLYTRNKPNHQNNPPPKQPPTKTVPIKTVPIKTVPIRTTPEPPKLLPAKVRVRPFVRRRTVGSASSKWRRPLYKRCLSCVNRAFRNLGKSMIPGMNPYAGTCNYGDFRQLGNKCARRCSRQYLYYCVAFMNQRFRTGIGHQRASAGLISTCRRFVSAKSILKKMRRHYSSSATNKKIIQRCLRDWRKLSR